jgi:hypothetical protein
MAKTPTSVVKPPQDTSRDSSPEDRDEDDSIFDPATASTKELAAYLKEVCEEWREDKEYIDRELYEAYRLKPKLLTLNQLEKLNLKYTALCRDIRQILYRRGVWIDSAKPVHQALFELLKNGWQPWSMEELEDRAIQGIMTPDQERLYFRHNPPELHLEPSKDPIKQPAQEPGYLNIPKSSASRASLGNPRQVSRQISRQYALRNSDYPRNTMSPVAEDDNEPCAPPVGYNGPRYSPGESPPAEDYYKSTNPFLKTPFQNNVRPLLKIPPQTSANPLLNVSPLFKEPAQQTFAQPSFQSESNAQQNAQYQQAAQLPSQPIQQYLNPPIFNKL